VSAAFGQLLRTFRLAADLTQAHLAELAGVSEQAISLLERGLRNRPRRDTVQALITALKLQPQDAETLLTAAQVRSAPTQAPPPPSEESAAAATTVPWQLPPTVADFTARTEELTAVLTALRSGGNASTLVTVTGMGGVGKTALAVHAGHLTADHFPDGQLYVKLRGYDPGAALTPAEALGQLLRSLGVRGDAIPSTVDEMAALYRSRIAGRRMLVLLDDASSVDQVAPLLAGDPHCATIVTSRRFLATLPGNLIVRLSPLTNHDAVTLLTKLAGEERVAAEHRTALQITRLTGRLPLALRLVGARLAARPQWRLQDVADQLADQHRRLDELGLDHSGVRASFAGSLDELLASRQMVDHHAAEMFDLLSLTEGPEISLSLAARLADRDIEAAELVLERLVDLHLLDSLGPRRYRMHDLLRTYAGERLNTPERQAERAEAIRRGLSFYLAAAWRVQRIASPWSTRRPTEELVETGVPEFTDLSNTLGWLDSEFDSLIDLYRRGHSVPGLQQRFGPSLALGLFGYLIARDSWNKMRLVYDLGLAAVDPSHDPAMAGWLEHDRAIPEIEQGNFDDGRRRVIRGFGLFEQAGDLDAMAVASTTLSFVHERLDLLDEAIRWGERGLAYAVQAGNSHVIGTSHLALGRLYNRVGRVEDADRTFHAGIDLAGDNLRVVARRRMIAAASYLDRADHERGIEHLVVARRLYRELDEPNGLAETLEFLVQALTALGRHSGARETALEALQLAEGSRDTYRQARVLGVLATVEEATGNLAEADALRRRAIKIFEADNVPHAAEALRKLLVGSD
jgi:transcriptional regulator with XRE-family HTH domain/tetratricopeptide (TPR) repeat protein